MPPNALPPRAGITAAEVVQALQSLGYRRGTYVAEYGWEYDRATCVRLAVTQTLSQARVPPGAIAPTDFTSLISAIVTLANQFLAREKQTGQVLT